MPNREINGSITEKAPLYFEESLHIYGDVLNGAVVTATGNIHIEGSVIHSKVVSLGGNVVVEGEVKGITAKIIAKEDAKIHTALNATIKASNNVEILDKAVDCHIVAKNSVFAMQGEGVLEGGEIESGSDIIAQIIGNFRKVPTHLKQTDFQKHAQYHQYQSLAIQYDELQRKLDHLDQRISIIKILGRNTVILSAEKKENLALLVKQYAEYKQSLAEVQNEMDDLLAQNEGSDKSFKTESVVIAKGWIYEGTVIEIGGSVKNIEENLKNVAIYQSDGIVIENYDDYQSRKAYF